MIKKNIFFAMLITFLGCSSIKCTHLTRKISVIGTALDDKDGAFVLTEKGMFFLDKIYEWGQQYYGKKVEVTGRLVIKRSENSDMKELKDTIAVQRFYGRKAIIKKPKWRLSN